MPRSIKKVCILLLFLAGIITVLFFLDKDILFCKQSTSPDVVYVGDPVRIQVNLIHKKKVVLATSDIKADLQALGAVQVLSRKIDLIFATLLSDQYILKIYSPGEYAVPEIKIEYKRDDDKEIGYIVFPEHSIKVNSVLPDDFKIRPARIRIGGSIDQGSSTPFKDQIDSDSSFNEITGPIRFKIIEKEKIRHPGVGRAVLFNFFIIPVAIILLAVCVILAIKNSGKFLRRKMSPTEQVLFSLAQLKEKGLYAKGNKKEYCGEVYRIMLFYIREHFGISDKEFFSDQLREQILNIDRVGLGYPEKKYLLDLFRLCENVKYAPDGTEDLYDELCVDDIMDFVKELSDLPETSGF